MERIFTKGLFFSRPKEGAPDFIKGHLDVNVDTFKAFLEEVKGSVNDRGFLKLDLLKSKDGTKLYFQVNTWKPKPKEEPQKDPLKPDYYPEEEINPDDIPF